MTSQHEFKNDVDRFMDHIKKTISLRLESNNLIVGGNELREESDKMLRDTEYMVYELIDNAMEEGVLHAQRD